MSDEKTIMKKRRPLRETVTHYIAASHSKKKTKPASMKDFFENLEHRGPFVPHSLFEQFTVTVRRRMQRERKWIQGNEDDLEFVAEYIAQLQREYFKFRKKQNFPDWQVYVDGRSAGFEKHYLEYRACYLKIRIWGLRTKRFRLRAWPLTQYPLIFGGTRLFPTDFNQRYENGESTFRYDIRSFDHHYAYTWVLKDFPRGNLSD